MSELRLYAIVNYEALKAAGGNRGKMMAQAGHAFMHAWWDADTASRQFYDPTRAKRYRESGAAVKIVLIGQNEAELRDYYDQIKDNKLGVGVTLVTDAGRTVFSGPTVTFLGIGPITREEAPDWLKSLKPLV